MTDDSTNGADPSVRSALVSFGISRVRLKPLSGGTLNRVYHVEVSSGRLVLKQYMPYVLKTLDLNSVCTAQETVRSHGLPVQALVHAVNGSRFTIEGESAFTLAEFIEGRTYGVDAIPERAAYRAGAMLARLQIALSDMPPGNAAPLWSPERIRAHLEELLAFANSRSRADPVDERASILLRQKLAMLDTLDTVPPYEPGWTHGDYQHTNVLFDDDDEVAGVIDFDTVAYSSPARDVMRCIALSFPNLGPSAFSFFEGYAAERGLKPDEAQSYVAFYRYISTYRVWPVTMRYLEPESYDARWDELIQPFPEWDWAMLSQRFAEIARAARNLDVRL